MNVGRPGCPVTVFSGVHGQPRPCDGLPTHTAVIRYRARRGWVRIFPCRVHAVDIPGAEPMTDRHRAMVADRKAQEARALAGLPWVPTPTSKEPDGV